MRILLDLDCVLADFVGAVAARYRVGKATVEANWPDRYDGIAEAIAKAGNLPLTADQFWGDLEHDDVFWFRIPEFPWFKQLVDLVRSLTDDWHIVTSPVVGNGCQACYSGKVAWLKTRFGRTFDRFAITPHKEIFAGPNVVLIDDHPKNTAKFEEYGGHAVLFPAVWNENRDAREDPLPFVTTELERVSRYTHHATKGH